MRKLLFILVLLVAAPVSATTWYGSPTGNDTHGCTNATTDACFSIGVVEAKASPGDTVYMQAGTYVGMGNQTLTKSGSSGNIIAVQGFAPAGSCPTSSDTDVFSPLGTNPAPTANLGTITVTISADYIRFDCFQLGIVNFTGTRKNIDIWDNYLPDTGSSRYPAAITNDLSGTQSVSNLTVEKNYIVNATEGTFLVFVSTGTISDNNIFKNKEYGTTDEEYNTLLFSNNVTYQKNYFHGTSFADCAGGISACHNDCLISWSTSNRVTHDITFTQNVCWNIMNGIIVADQNCTSSCSSSSWPYEYNWTITNNLFGYDYGTAASGAYNGSCFVADEGYTYGHVGHIKFDNNDCITGAVWAGFASLFDSIQNNIINNSNHITGPPAACTHPLAFSDSATAVTTEGHNLMYSQGSCTLTATGTPTYSGTDILLSISGTGPKFVNENDCNQYLGSCFQSPSNQDFHPASTSPLIGAGATVSDVTVDLYGTTRPSPPAIGAIEPAGTTACTIGFSPTSLSFGNVNIGASSAAQIVTVSNTGTATCSVTANSFTTGTQFSIGTGSGACSAVTYNLIVGSSCKYYVTFSPTSAGAKSDTYTLTDNASPTTQSFTVSGTGVVPSYTYSYCGTGGAYVTVTTNTICSVTSPGKNYQPVLVFMTGEGSGTPATLSSMSWSGTGTGTWSLISGTRATNTHSGVQSDVEIWTPNAQTIGGETAVSLTASASTSANIVVYFVPNVNTVDVACELSTQTASYPGTATGCSLVTAQATEFLIEAGVYDMSVSGSPSSPFGYDFTQNPPSFTFSASVTSTGTYHSDLTRGSSSYSGTYAVSGVGLYSSSAPPPPANVTATPGGVPTQ